MKFVKETLKTTIIKQTIKREFWGDTCEIDLKKKIFIKC